MIMALTVLMVSLKTATPNIHTGQVVLLMDENEPSVSRPLGPIIEVHPSKDGLKRVVTVECRNLIFKKPVTNVAILPIFQDIVHDRVGGCFAE